MPAGAPDPPRDRAGRFVNWARTAVSPPVRWHLPTSEAELCRIVERAAARGVRLRVVGSGHSFSRIAVPDGEAVSLALWSGGPVINRRRATVTVPAGMRMRELSSVLLRAGFSLPIVGSIQAQTVAGAIATGTHGSSLQYGTIATLVTGLRIVDGTGNVLVLGDDDERLDGARVHLGALGAVTEATLRIRPTVRLRQSIEHVPIETLPDRLAQIASSAEYVKVWWLPHTRFAQVARCGRTTDPITRRPAVSTQRRVAQALIGSGVFSAALAVQHRYPDLTAAINTRLSRLYLGTAAQVGPDILMLTTPTSVRHRETEAAVPIAQAGQALNGVIALFDNGGPPGANFPVEVRFVRADNTWMSPAQGADTCTIGAYLTDGPEWHDYFERFWQLMRALGARPHWGKEFDHRSSELRELYPDYDRFLHLRDAIDPQRVFGSTAHSQILGD